LTDYEDDLPHIENHIFKKGGDGMREHTHPLLNHEEMPNILKLSTPFGRLKAMVETMAEFSEAEGEINKKGEMKK
jgi:hypothetical protein